MRAGCVTIPPLARAQFISLVDYGCSEGGNSAKQFRFIQEALRKGGALEAVRRPRCTHRTSLRTMLCLY